LINSESYCPQLREYCPRAFGTWAIFPQLREISLTIDPDASHYLHNTIIETKQVHSEKHDSLTTEYNHVAVSGSTGCTEIHATGKSADVC